MELSIAFGISLIALVCTGLVFFIGFIAVISSRGPISDPTDFFVQYVLNFFFALAIMMLSTHLMAS